MGRNRSFFLYQKSFISFLQKTVVSIINIIYNEDGDRMNYKVMIHDEEEMMELAQNIESEKFPNMVICLDGELGSGKTVFVKGFAQALGIKEVITSPTFNLVKEYLGGELPLYHMDVYRLNNNNQNIGLNEYFNKDAISIVEWSELITDYLPEERLQITFKIIDENMNKL